MTTRDGVMDQQAKVLGFKHPTHSRMFGDFMPVLQINVKPNSKIQAIETLEDGSLIVRLKSSPVDGKANTELIALLAKQFAVPKSSVRIKSGQTSRHKLVKVDDS